MAKIHLASYDNFLEDAQQARKFYGVNSLDKLCSFCENVLTLEEQQISECPHCGEHAGLIDIT